MLDSLTSNIKIETDFFEEESDDENSKNIPEIISTTSSAIHTAATTATSEDDVFTDKEVILKIYSKKNKRFIELNLFFSQDSLHYKSSHC